MIQLVQVFNWFKGSIGSRVQLVQKLNWFNRFKVSSKLLVKAFNWLKGSTGSKVQLTEFIPLKLSWLAQLNLSLARLSPSLFMDFFLLLGKLVQMKSEQANRNVCNSLIITQIAFTELILQLFELQWNVKILHNYGPPRPLYNHM